MSDPARTSVPMRLLALQAVLVAAITSLGTQLLLAATNTLAHNGRWTSAKVELEKGVIGSVATLVTRRPLRRGRLDLSAYHGFQQLQLDTGEPAARLRFRFLADGPAYLDVLFGPSADVLSGVRISRHPDYRSLRYSLGPDGGFVKPEALALGEPQPRAGWNAVSLEFGKGSVAFALNGGAPLRLPGTSDPIRNVGFRGSMRGTSIDDVVVDFEGGGPPLRETFANQRGRGGYWLLFASLLIGVGGLARRALRGWLGFERLAAHFACVTGYGVTLVCLAAYGAVDHFYLSGLYPSDYSVLTAEGHRNRIEPREAARLRIAREIDALPSDGRTVVLVIGTSQTWGAGARRADDAWVEVLERRLNALGAASGRRFAVVNAGVSGSWSQQLLEAYESEWLRAEPDLVVVVLGTNDWEARLLEGALRRFATLGADRGIATVFVAEPNATEAGDSEQLVENHRAMRKVALWRGVPLIEAHRHLHQRRESGFLWWDFTHLTSYGQQLLGDFVAGELVRERVGRSRALDTGVAGAGETVDGAVASAVGARAARARIAERIR